MSRKKKLQVVSIVKKASLLHLEPSKIVQDVLKLKDTALELYKHYQSIGISDALRTVQAKIHFDFCQKPADSQSFTRAMQPGQSGPENIIGTCIGESRQNDLPTGKLSVIVMVKRKIRDEDKIQPQSMLPESVTYEGHEYPVDVIETGEIFAGTQQGTPDHPQFPEDIDPAICGCSIGLRGGQDAGTLGCLVRVKRIGGNDKVCILSNNHVIGGINKANEGDDIMQPGEFDSINGFPARVIAKVQKVLPIEFSGTNTVDAALGFTGRELCSTESRSYTLSPQTKLPSPNTVVIKDGRTTGFTKGNIIGVNGDTQVNYGTKKNPRLARFTDQIVISPMGGFPRFSNAGDSGSLVVDAITFQPIALLFAGGEASDGSSVTFANPIQHVMDKLGIIEFLDSFPEDDG